MADLNHVIIVGKLTRDAEPPRHKLEELIAALSPHTKVCLKKNLRRLLPEHKLYEASGAVQAAADSSKRLDGLLAQGD